MFEISGKIEFDPINVTRKHHKQSAWKKTAIIKFNCDTCEYYAWFLKKRFGIILNKPLRGTHITAISEIIDDDIYNDARKIFNGKEIKISYDPTLIRSNEAGHWWIRVQSQDIENIRSAMGLTPIPYFGLHLTIGLATHLQLEQSQYILRQCLKFNI